MPNDNRPNLLLIVSEDNGPHMRCYGDPNARTPNLDQLATEGVRFANHHTTCAVCSPGRASILTGLYPHQNGQINLATHNYAMYRGFANLPSIIKEQGYRTARLGKLHVAPEAAMPFDFVWNEGDFISFRNRDVVRTAEVAGAFAAESDEPFFMYTCFADAHLPALHQSFGVPANPQSGDDITLPPFCPIDAPHIRDRLAGYYNCLERLDTGIGLLIDTLKQKTKRETIVVFTTDHGQQFIRGKVTCYEGGLRVPLIVHAPGRVSSGSVREELTSHVDILPTILEMLGIDVPAMRPGMSLMPLAQDNQNVTWRDYVVGQWTGSPAHWFPQRSIRNARYKLIVNYLAPLKNANASSYLPPNGAWETSLDEQDFAAADPALRAALERSAQPPHEELYDLHEDPTELHNLAGRADLAQVQDELRAELVTWQKQHDDRIADPQVLSALGQMHLDLERTHYPTGRGRPINKDFTWDYACWIDPGIPQ